MNNSYPLVTKDSEHTGLRLSFGPLESKRRIFPNAHLCVCAILAFDASKNQVEHDLELSISNVSLTLAIYEGDDFIERNSLCFDRVSLTEGGIASFDLEPGQHAEVVMGSIKYNDKSPSIPLNVRGIVAEEVPVCPAVKAVKRITRMARRCLAAPCF